MTVRRTRLEIQHEEHEVFRTRLRRLTEEMAARRKAREDVWGVQTGRFRNGKFEPNEDSK